MGRRPQAPARATLFEQAPAPGSDVSFRSGEARCVRPASHRRPDPVRLWVPQSPLVDGRGRVGLSTSPPTVAILVEAGAVAAGPISGSTGNTGTAGIVRTAGIAATAVSAEGAGGARTGVTANVTGDQLNWPDIQRFRDGLGHAGRAETVERQMPCIAQPCNLTATTTLWRHSPATTDLTPGQPRGTAGADSEPGSGVVGAVPVTPRAMTDGSAGSAPAVARRMRASNPRSGALGGGGRVPRAHAMGRTS